MILATEGLIEELRQIERALKLRIERMQSETLSSLPARVVQNTRFRKKQSILRHRVVGARSSQNEPVRTAER